jgi:DNA invertase Pin-like site-specific DNA recombinase
MFLATINNNSFKPAIYIRLSREDGDKRESESVTNQRDIIKRWLNENNLQSVCEYVDDGISGTTFDRAGFTNMIQDIEIRQNKYGSSKRPI